MRIFPKGLCLTLCALLSPILACALTTPSVSVTPGYSTIATSGTLQYAATVSGLANTAVTWQVNGVAGGNATVGTISPSGLYQAPASIPAAEILVIALASDNKTEGMEYVNVAASGPAISAVTPAPVALGNYSVSVRGSGFVYGAIVRNGASNLATTFLNSTTLIASGYQGTSGTGSFQVMNPGSLWGAVTVVAFGVAPAAATVDLGQTQQFAATGSTGWKASAGTISAAGLYTAPATMPASTSVTITASTATGLATASVTLVTPPPVITPGSASLLLGKTLQFSATYATSYTLSAGTLSSTGLYTAPSTMPSSGTAMLTATGPGGSSTAIITLLAPPTLSPTSASVALGKTIQFTGSNATSYVLTAGTLSATGLYTAPTTMPASGIATLTATGPGGSISATITLLSAQTISPASASVALNQTQQFTSAGATSWSAIYGTVSSAGLYTAPRTLPSSSSDTVMASGTNGSATAQITLTAPSSGASSGTVSIAVESPLYGWELIPGATRRIHATVTNGSSNEVTWSYTTAGGATATLTPAPSPNILGAFVDITVGSVGASCTNTGTATAPVITSAASITLKATSVDDKTKSISIPVQVCNPTAQAFVSPFNVRLYSGQTVDLQSWVWGAVNDNVTWTITQPSGGNGKFTAPPAGGSASTARDAVFSATVAGEYTVTATSVANSSVSASAILSVDSAGMPAYAATPNHTVPVDCSVNPAQTGTTYDIGAGHAYASLAAAFVAIGSNTLNAGTTIRLFNTDTTGTNPTHFHEYLRIDGKGTEAAPIRIVGCADAAGNLPVIDGANATSYSPTDNSSGITGLYQIAFHSSNVFGVYPNINSPSYIIVEGLAFRNAYPTAASGASNYFYAPGSSSATQWGTVASCIRPYEGNHVSIRGNDVEDCSFGILADFNGNNGWGGFFGDLNLEGNYFTNIGAATETEHMAYVQGFRQVIQGNTFDQLKSVSQAGELKMRGVAEVVRYNKFNTSTNTRTIDFVEEQDSNMYMSFLGYYYTPSGGESFHSEYTNDAYTPDLLAAADEAWHKAYVYGNIVNFGPNTPTVQAPVHFFGDQGAYPDQNTNPPGRVGDLFDYSNTFYSVGSNSLHLVDTQQNQDNQIRAEWPALTLWNNAMYVGTLNNAGYQDFQMSTLRSDFYTLGPNWLSSNWGNNTTTCSSNAGDACIGTGWPYQMETTQYMDGANLPAHITGLSNLITGGSTIPFSTSTWVPTSGGGLVGAGTALPATISNMPVRFQMSGFELTPRTTPLTLGAHD